MVTQTGSWGTIQRSYPFGMTIQGVSDEKVCAYKHWYRDCDNYPGLSGQGEKPQEGTGGITVEWSGTASKPKVKVKIYGEVCSECVCIEKSKVSTEEDLARGKGKYTSVPERFIGGIDDGIGQSPWGGVEQGRTGFGQSQVSARGITVTIYEKASGWCDDIVAPNALVYGCKGGPVCVPSCETVRPRWEEEFGPADFKDEDGKCTLAHIDWTGPEAGCTDASWTRFKAAHPSLSMFGHRGQAELAGEAAGKAIKNFIQKWKRKPSCISTQKSTATSLDYGTTIQWPTT